MSQPPDQSPLAQRLARLGDELGSRESEHALGLKHARASLEQVRAAVERALSQFHRAASQAGAPHLRAEVSEIRTDDKHLRAIEFEVTRGRHVAIVTAKSRGEITFVGPFRRGKTEGPCLTFPLDAADEIGQALGDFLERFLRDAATP
jgi:hypothetical protein